MFLRSFAPCFWGTYYCQYALKNQGRRVENRMLDPGGTSQAFNGKRTANKDFIFMK
jgi:hypothetical protein